MVLGYEGGPANSAPKKPGQPGDHAMPAAARGYRGAPLPTSARRLDGCLFETRRSNAPVLNTPMGDVPTSVDLRQYCSPVEDQGQSNSCTANATVGALEYHQRRTGGAFTDISRLFVYWNSRQLAGAQNDDCGSFIHHSMAAVLAHGACEEKVWPFDLAQVLAQPPQAAYQNGGSHEAVQYARTMLGNPVIQALAAGLPVVFGTYAPSRFYDEAAKSGLMPSPAERLDPPGGGHAMLIVGYDLATRTWLVRNSWGEGWADKGYFRVPFATIEAYSYPDHFWAIGAIEGKQGLSLSGPSPTQAAQAVRADAAAELREALAKLRGDLRSDFQTELDRQKAEIRNRLRTPDKT
jgi:C1A family cysteine protease